MDSLLKAERAHIIINEFTSAIELNYVDSLLHLSGHFIVPLHQNVFEFIACSHEKHMGVSTVVVHNDHTILFARITFAFDIMTVDGHLLQDLGRSLFDCSEW